jgi:hypothetical protein
MPHSFATSPGATGNQRKFVNRTPGWVGANVFGPDGKPTAIAVESGAEVWLTPEEERMTAEAPRYAADNPFVKEWDEVTETDSFGEAVTTVRRAGTLVLANEPARPVSSDRFVPEREETLTGAPPLSEQPAVEGQPSPEEIVATPEAVAANDKAVTARKPTAEQPVRPKPVPTE